MTRWKALIAALALSACQAAPAGMQPVGAEGRAIVLGHAFEVSSAALGETRRLNVYLPASYVEGTKRYPVLYLVDGGVAQDFVHVAGLSQHAGISASFQEMIVVGVETVDRRRELTAPATRDASLRVEYPTHGEATKFRAFIADEVKPWVEKRYRTSGVNAIMGESLAGLFVAETFLRQPDLFEGYIAIDPSLWWDDRALSNETVSLMAAQPPGSRKLYVAVANSGPAMRLPQVQFANAVRNAGKEGLAFTYVAMEDEEHSTIYHRAALEALRLVFANAPDVKAN